MLHHDPASKAPREEAPPLLEAPPSLGRAQASPLAPPPGDCTPAEDRNCLDLCFEFSSICPEDQGAGVGRQHEG